MADEGRVPERGKDRGCVPLACCWDGAGCRLRGEVVIRSTGGIGGGAARQEDQKGLRQLDTEHDGKIIVFQAQGDLGLSPEPTDLQL